MKLTILYFAAVRDLVGKAEETITTTAPTIADLAMFLEEHHAALQGRLASVRFAVNEDIAISTTPLRDGDTIALIPPVAGG